MLPVQIDEHAPDLREPRRRHRRPVDPGAGATRRAHFATQHDQRVVHVDPSFVEHRAQLGSRRRIEHALDGRAIGARAHDVGGAAFAEEQAERPNNDGFPRAGLAGEDVEAWPERERQRFDDREVLNPQLGQHYGIGLASEFRPSPASAAASRRNWIREIGRS